VREKLKIDLIFLQRGSLRSTDEAKYNRVNQRIIIREASHDLSKKIVFTTM